MSVRYLFKGLVWLTLAVCALPAGSRAQSISAARQAASAACLIKTSASRLHIREATGNNDGAEIDALLRACGAALRSPWCGCEQYVEQKACGLPAPKGAAGSYNWFLPANPRTYYIAGRRGTVDSVKAGHQVGFYYTNLGRIGHVGRAIEATRPVRKGRPTRGWIVRAGNTGRGGGRDGAGVYDVFYPAAAISAAANWTY